MSIVLGGGASGRLPELQSPVVNERIFLEQTLAELTNLQQAAEVYYHGVLARILASALSEARMLLREIDQVEGWPDSAEQPLGKIR